MLAEAYRSNSLTYAGESVPFYWAGALLQTSVQSAEATGKTSSHRTRTNASARTNPQGAAADHDPYAAAPAIAKTWCRHRS